MPPSNGPSRRQLLSRIALIAGAVYAAPMVAELSTAEAQPREWRGSRPSRPSRNSRPSRPSRPSRRGRQSRPSRPSRFDRASRPRRGEWVSRPYDRRGDGWFGDDRRDAPRLPEWAAPFFPR